MAEDRKEERAEPEPKLQRFAWRQRRASREELEAFRGKSVDEVNAYLEEHFLKER